tara:strand:+ start:2584 stop:3039 length:456 start_codon:yes stop_codon:yes gene_type:complete
MSLEIFQNYARQIKKETGIDCLSKKRTDAHAIARSILNRVYMDSQLDVSYHKLQELYKENGWEINHATILHSLKSFDMYNTLPKSKQKMELGKTVKTVYYRLLLFYNAFGKNMNISEKMEHLLPHQVKEVHDLVNHYALENTINYAKETED